MDDIGPLAPGQTKTITVKVKVPSGSAPGQLSAVAVAESACPVVLQPSSQPIGNPPADIPVRGEDSVTGPTVTAPVAEVNSPQCTVPDLVGKTVEEATALLEAAGCKLGEVKDDPNGKPEDAGKITGSNPDAGTTVPKDTPVDVTVVPKPCTVPNVVGKTEAEAKALLEAAGCKVGDVTPDDTHPEDAGKITKQGTPEGTQAPPGTEVDLSIAGPLCTVPNLAGKTEAEARAAVEAQGCKLATKNEVTTNPDLYGKVTTQNPAADLHVPKGSTIEVTLGVQSIGTDVLGQQAEKAGTAGPTLVRTGGVAFGGLALWLLVSGLLAQTVGSRRLWQLIRRVKG
jgi:serine/threonine-protein kinase